MPVATSTPHKTLAYRREIDGMRALAVLSVIAFHYFPQQLPGGFIGVDIFFVISGFLISRLIWDALDKGTFSFSYFYASRIRRIFPALFVVLAATWGIGKLLLFWDDFARLGLHTLSGAFFFSNFTLLEEGGYFDISAERKPLLHLWSLSIEEQFYLVWPLLLVLLSKLRIRFATVGAAFLCASFLYNLWLLTHNSNAAFFNPLGRGWELIFGALMGAYVRTQGGIERRKSIIASTVAIATLVACICLVDTSLPFPGFVALLPVAATGFLLASSEAEGAGVKLLSTKLAVGVGLISYPLYLWHWPLFSFAHLKYNGDIPLSVKCGLIFLAFVLATITYKGIESPIRRSRRRTDLVVALVALVFSIGLVGGITHVKRGFVAQSQLPTIAPYLAQANTFSDWLTGVRAGTCYIHGIGVSQHAASCVETKRPMVLLWGDSHAASLYPGLLELQKTEPFGITQMTASACPPLPDSYSVACTACDDINRAIMDTARSLQPEVVVLASSWRLRHSSLSNEEIVEKCSQQIDAVKAASPNSRIVIVGPLSRWEPGLAQVLNTYVSETGTAPPIRLPKQNTVDNRKRAELTLLLESLAAQKSVSFLAPDQYLCNEDGCLTRLGDSRAEFASFDGEHLNPGAAALVAEGLRPLLFPRGQGHRESAHPVP